MRLNFKNEHRERAKAGAAFKRAGRASCRKALAQMQAVKDAIYGESFRTVQPQERLLRLALNEAEALAWQTKYPQLVFPALANEKVQGVIAWNRRQQARRQAEAVSVPAAGPAAYVNN